MTSNRPHHPDPILPQAFSELPSVTAGFSLRTGGLSQAPYDSLNLGLSTGDDEETVRENRRRLFRPLGIRLDRLAIAGQVHGSEVREVTEAGLYPGFDGLVTKTPDLVLCISSADCAVVLLADPDARVAGACHSGWRGTVDDIAGKTVRAMSRLGAVPAATRAYISPCISTEFFEVGEEVAVQFAPDYVVRRTDWPRPHVDLKSAIAGQLVQAGLSAGAVEVSDRCTFSETGEFFSYRAENGVTGRMMGYIFLNA